MHARATTTGDPIRTIERRDLIRRAAVAGGVAWAAPVILTSLTSPAAAATPSCTCTNSTTLRRTWSEIKTPDYNDFDNKCAPLVPGSNVPTPLGSCIPGPCFSTPTTCTDPLGGTFAFDKPVPSTSSFSITLATPNPAGERIIDGRLACTEGAGVPTSVGSCTTGTLSNTDRTITFNKCPTGHKAFVYITWCGTST